jgi:hypothetical protein
MDSGGSAHIELEGPVGVDAPENLLSGLGAIEQTGTGQREAAIRAAGRGRATSSVAVAGAGEKATKPDKGGATKERGSGRGQLAELIPDALRLPVALVLGAGAMLGTVVAWVACANAAERILYFFALFVPLAGAGVIRLLTLDRTFVLGLLGIAMGAAAIAAGKYAVAKGVVIPYYQKKANEECLVDLPKLLADERLQLKQGASAKSIAQDADFMMCVALISLVDEGQADAVNVRKWAIQILLDSNKTNILAFFSEAGTGSSSTPKREIEPEQEEIYGKANARMFEWEQEETSIRWARKYYPAINRLGGQVEMQRILEKPETMMRVAVIETIGVLDLIWVLGGLGLAYLILVAD